jgi:DNA invertase Pin-like site-specific DNA recombinase
MSMTTAAYLRVSTGQQSIDQQHDAIAAAGHHSRLSLHRHRVRSRWQQPTRLD